MTVFPTPGHLASWAGAAATETATATAISKALSALPPWLRPAPRTPTSLPNTAASVRGEGR